MDIPRKELVEVSIEIISEYLDQNLKDKLFAHYDLTTKNFLDQFIYKGMPKMEEKKKKAPVKKQRSINKLKNVDISGMKTLSNFFAVKKKVTPQNSREDLSSSSLPTSQSSQQTTEEKKEKK